MKNGVVAFDWSLVTVTIVVVVVECGMQKPWLRISHAHKTDSQLALVLLFRVFACFGDRTERLESLGLKQQWLAFDMHVYTQIKFLGVLDCSTSYRSWQQHTLCGNADFYFPPFKQRKNQWKIPLNTLKTITFHSLSLSRSIARPLAIPTLTSDPWSESLAR